MCYTDSARSVGVDDGEVPPVPIPNTEVKLSCAENTWREAAWKDRSSPTPGKELHLCPALYSSIAQSVEHATVNRRVVGSSPTWGAMLRSIRFSDASFLRMKS